MRTALKRAPLEGAVQLALAAAVTMFTLHSSVVSDVQRVSLHGRWLALAALCVLSLVLVAARPVLARPSLAVYGLGALLAAAAVVSAAWSAYPRLSLERGGTFAVAVVAAGAIGIVAAGRPAFARGVLGTLVATATGVAVAGFAMLAIDRERAIQGATADAPARLLGIGMNPNTASLLYTLTLPLAVWFALEARGRRDRLLGGGAAGLIAVSMFASGSRGATVASFVGVALVVIVRPAPARRRASFVGATFAIYLVGVLAADMRSLQPEFVRAVPARQVAAPELGPAGGPPATPGEGTGPAPGSGGPSTKPSRGKELAPGIFLPSTGPVETRWQRAFPNVRPNFSYDVYLVGFERPAGVFQPTQSGLFRGSGRLQVWSGAFDEAVKRPLLGFGFGLEEQVFIDRFYGFQGSRPENSYLGWMLQLGLVGAALFVAIGVATARSVLRAGPLSAEAVAAGAAVAAGFVVSVMQSFIYSVGNLSTLAFWTLVAVAAGASARVAGREASPPVAGARRLALFATAGLLLMAMLAGLGRAERGRWVEAQRDGINAVVETIGGRYLSRSVSDVWVDYWRPTVGCVRYAHGGDPYAMQLCFDSHGRLIEAYDERGGTVRIYDLHVEPEASRLKITPEELKLIRRYVTTTQAEIARSSRAAASQPEP